MESFPGKLNAFVSSLSAFQRGCEKGTDPASMLKLLERNGDSLKQPYVLT